jgi:hypothetical protein
MWRLMVLTQLGDGGPQAEVQQLRQPACIAAAAALYAFYVI